MPRLWTETIETHRREVGDAILDTTAALVARYGLRSVTMSQIADKTGIGRATLYKYYPDVETILATWHERHVAAHLKDLAKLRDDRRNIATRVEVFLDRYAMIVHQRQRNEFAAFLHRGAHVQKAERTLHSLLRHLLREAATEGAIRNDIAPSELANYCLHALSAADSLKSRDAARRLVKLTLAALRPQRKTR